MLKRIITGAVFALIMVAGVYFQGWLMLAILAFAMVVSVYEVCHALENTGARPMRWVSYLFCALTIAAHVSGRLLVQGQSLHVSMMALLLSTMAAMTYLVVRGREAMECLTASMFPLLYPGLLYIVLMELLRLKNAAAVTVALIIALFAASINDVFALFTGMLLGRHKLAPELSPKKTIEGSIGGLVASTLFAMAVPALTRLIFAGNPSVISSINTLPPTWAFACLGLFGGIFSQVGDLSASMVKRHCGIKDYGKLLPGHGGVMDRMDGVLFCGAVCYIFFNLVGLG